MNETLQIADQIIRWLTPIIAGFITLLVFIYRSKVRELEKLIESGKKEQEKEISDIMHTIALNEEVRKDSYKDLLILLKEGLREEREFRTDKIIMQSNQIEKIFGKLEDVLVSTGRIDQRIESHFVYFITTSTGSLDAGGDEHFTIGTNEARTQTWIDFCPNYSYEAGGGFVEILSSTSTGLCKVKFIGAPDYPPEYGGSVEFIKNKKLSLVRPEFSMLDIDPKLMRYSASTPGTNKLRLLVEHSSGECISFEYYLVMSSDL